jgi:Na+-transporting methylmalonyl-CoA/oxaloacetate decarboxylase beta subunit
MAQNAGHLVKNQSLLYPTTLRVVILHHIAFIYDMLAGKLLKSKYTKEKKNN